MEIFEYEVEPGAVMDYLDHRFVLVIKEEEWNSEQKNLLAQPVTLSAGSLDGILYFVVESAPIDSADFYYSVENSDQKDQLLQDLKEGKHVDVDLYFLDGANQIISKRSRTLDEENSALLKELIEAQQALIPSMQDYEKRIDRIQSRFEPFELAEKASFAVKM